MHVGRILSSTKDEKACGGHNDASVKGDRNESGSKGAHLSQFLPTSRRIVQFSNGKVCFKHSLVVTQYLGATGALCINNNNNKQKSYN